MLRFRWEYFDLTSTALRLVAHQAMLASVGAVCQLLSADSWMGIGSSVKEITVIGCNERVCGCSIHHLLVSEAPPSFLFLHFTGNFLSDIFSITGSNISQQVFVNPQRGLSSHVGAERSRKLAVGWSLHGVFKCSFFGWDTVSQSIFI